MKITRFITLAAAITFATFALSWKTESKDLKKQVDEWLSSSSEKPEGALIEKLRQDGQQSLEWLKKHYWQNGLSYDSYRGQKRFLLLFDQVSGQKDAIASGLFWHFNLQEALAESKLSKKPVLCLKMLGDLREDFSCANSRFFRTLLYSDPEVARELRDNFVLCWESVSRVPKVTIEYPDGKKQIQTITGNSMHLALSPEGKILDALPGLYGPQFFRQWLQQLKTSEPEISALREKRIIALSDASLSGKVMKEEWYDLVNESAINPSMPVAALRASEISLAKSVVERPLYSGVYGVDKKKIKEGKGNTQGFPGYSAYGFVWETVSAGTVDLIKAKKNYTRDELSRTLYDIEEKLSKEAVRNELNLHLPILQKLRSFTADQDSFTKWVYRDLFLTPLDDPKMGLYDRSVFSGLTNDGFLDEQ